MSLQELAGFSNVPTGGGGSVVIGGSVVVGDSVVVGGSVVVENSMVVVTSGAGSVGVTEVPKF